MSKLGACVDTTLTWIGNNKMVTLLGLVAFSLMVSTWTLAAINVKLNDEIDAFHCPDASSTAATQPTSLESTTTVESTVVSDSSTASTTLGSNLAEKELRLSAFVIPTDYDLLIHPDLTPDGSGRFSGNVKIKLNVMEPIEEIILHSHELHITDVKFNAPGTSTRVLNYQLLIELEQLKVTLSSRIEPGTDYELDISFNGSMRDKIVGLYSSTYKDVNGNDRYIATSKFEPTFARQSFPCFDEPSMKATFKISLIRPAENGYSALSNMGQEGPEEDYGNGLMKVNFQKSVPMSTYLTVFIVSDFVFKSQTIEPSVGQPFELRCFSTPAQVDKLDFALQTSVDVIKYYINYFNIEYPLPKLDLAAIPDFVSGAMETWGLVTYRETNLLYDRQVSSTANKQRIASVIGHEFAHMWFGNLVTMKWWSDLWLNEGFASYIEFKGVDAAWPEWKIMDQFTVDTMHSIMNLDATLGSHPIVTGVQTPDQITEIFDSITYNKGASIIRMVEDFIGEEKFRTGVSEYLDANKYMNADSNDLVKHLDGKVEQNVFEFLNTWIRQKGLPVVTVTRDGDNFRLTQKRFLTDPENENKETEASEFGYKWSIPITYVTSENPTEVKREWFPFASEELVIPVSQSVDWIKINKDQVGYYRVKYEKNMWQSLNNALEQNIDSMTPLDRAHLLNDVFSLAEGLQVPYDTALTMTKYLKKETHFVPWDVASSKLNSIKNLLYFTEVYPKFKQYLAQLVDEAYESLLWDVNPDEHLINLFRNTILSFACSVDHPKCKSTIGDEFRKWINSENYDTVRPSPDLRSLIYYHGMRTVGGEAEWNKMFDLFVKEQDASEKTKLQSGLAASSELWILKRFIDLASKDERYVRKQDYFSLLGSISGNRNGERLVWDYVRDHWQEISARFGLNERNLGRLIPTITARFTTQSKLKEMKLFFEEYPEAGAGANARIQALEAVQNNINWLENNQQAIEDWLQSQ